MLLTLSNIIDGELVNGLTDSDVFAKKHLYVVNANETLIDIFLIRAVHLL